MRDNKIVAIIRDVEPYYVTDIVRVLIEEGIDTVEVSLSNEDLGLKCIKKLSETFNNDELYLGAGTVLTMKQVDQVLLNGGKYIITPGWNKELVSKVIERGVPIWPGVFSPGEISEGIELGLNEFKLFPINSFNESYLKALRGPYPQIKLIGVGGINTDNMDYYSELGITMFGIGSELVSRGATEKDIPEIRKTAKRYREKIKEIVEKK